jgi:hypothetical protein
MPFAPASVFDVPQWVIGPSDVGLASPMLEEFKFPDCLTLVGTLKPIWVDVPAMGCYRDNSGAAFVPTTLYRDRSALARIEWIADWQEGTDGGAHALFEPFSFAMDFAFQHKNVISQYHLPSYEHPGFWHATGKTIEPVWSWGGVYYPGCALVDIKQRYFSISPDGAQRRELNNVHDQAKDSQGAQGGTHDEGSINTKIVWFSTINPRSQKLCDAVGTNWAAADVALHEAETASAIFQPMSLLNHIQFGSIQYFLPHVTDSIGYQSADVVDYDAQNGRVKLLFLRRNHGNTITKS